MNGSVYGSDQFQTNVTNQVITINERIRGSDVGIDNNENHNNNNKITGIKTRKMRK